MTEHDTEHSDRQGKPTAIVTGASSGVGLYTSLALTQAGWHVVMACRDLTRAQSAAEAAGIAGDVITLMAIDLGDQASVRAFVDAFHDSGRSLNALVNNAAIYLPRLKQARRSPEGFEISVATNHLGHYLLTRLLLDDLKESTGRTPRVVTLGTVTANSEEFGGRIPIPAPANLGDLSGLKAGFKAPVAMIDGTRFKPGKAYKDSKLCNMIISRELHQRYHDSTGIIFSTVYPGCVADTALFRATPKLFQKIFPWFQKNITGGYVTQELAGQRVAQAVTDPGLAQSGVHWSWGNRQKRGRAAFSQPLSSKATDPDLGKRLWEYSAELTGLPAR